MSFNLYNLLSYIIPGFILYIAGLHYLDISPNYYPAISAIAIAYILGYFICIIAGWLEVFLFWTWGGEPGLQLLEGKKCGRIKFYETTRIKSLVKNDEEESNIKIFQIAMRLSSQGAKVSEMNASYAFSKSILISIIIIYLILSSLYYGSIFFHVVCILMIFMAWRRSKERGFYYAKEILMEAVNNMKS